MHSEIRKDYIQEKYVIIAPRRGKRPTDVERRVAPAISAADCTFCPGVVDRGNRILSTVTATRRPGELWAIKVITNKFPAVTVTNPKAYGRQEVIIETPDHRRETETLSPARVAEIFKVYADRTRIISKDRKIEYILIFKNDGGAAGASLRHTHSQIFASKFLPPHLKDKSQRVQAYKLEHGRCVYCDVIEKEQKGPRLIAHDRNVIAFCPWAPMHNYEAWLMPKRHLDNVTVLTAAERLSFAKLLQKILKKIKI